MEEETRMGFEEGVVRNEAGETDRSPVIQELNGQGRGYDLKKLLPSK